MNVLFLNSIEKTIYGGMEEWIRLVASGLHQKGHNVCIAGRESSNFLKRVSVASPEIELLPLDISGDFNPVTISKIHSEIKSRSIDFIIVNFNKDVRLGGLAAKFKKDCKVIWSVGLDITKDSLIHKILTPKLVDGVIVPSAALKNQITRHGYIKPEQVEVIPIGIPDVDVTIIRQQAREQLFERFELKHDAIVCVTCGRFVEQKGHRYLVEAAPGIFEKVPKAIFLLLGDGELGKELKSQAKQLNIEHRFVFAGMQDCVEAILPGCDLMIHPSIEEPFGIAILEGMRAGLPVVASRVGGIPEVVREKETALLIEPKHPGLLTESVVSLLTSSSKLIQLGEAGRNRWQEYFGYERTIKNVENYLTNQRKGKEIYGTSETART